MQAMCVERGLLEVVRGGAVSDGMKGAKMKVEEKKRAFEEWLLCNSMEEYERYREKCGNQAKGGGSKEDVKF